MARRRRSGTTVKSNDVVIRTLPAPERIPERWGLFEILLTLLVVVAAFGVIYIIGVEMEWLPDFFGLNSFKTAVPTGGNGGTQSAGDGSTTSATVFQGWSRTSRMVVGFLGVVMLGTLAYSAYERNRRRKEQEQRKQETADRQAAEAETGLVRGILASSRLSTRRRAEDSIGFQKQLVEAYEKSLEQTKNKLLELEIKTKGLMGTDEAFNNEHAIDRFEAEEGDEEGDLIQIVPKTIKAEALWNHAGLPMSGLMVNDSQDVIDEMVASANKLTTEVQDLQDLIKESKAQIEKDESSLKRKKTVRFVVE